MRELGRLEKSVKKSGSDMAKPFMLECIPPVEERAVIIFVVCRGKRSSAIRSMMPNLAGDALERYSGRDCLLMLRNLDSMEAVSSFYFCPAHP